MANFFIIATLAVLTVLSSVYVTAQMSDSDVVDITAEVAGPTPPPGSGGGGVIQGTVVISGFTFPGAKLTLLKDGAITTTLIANPDGTFQITINSLSFGNYQLSIFAEDNRGIISAPYTVNAAVFSSQPYTFSNIIIPPTIAADTLLVAAGQTFTVSGYAPPNSNISLEIPGSSILGTVTTNMSGYYQIPTRASMPPNTYSLRSKAVYNGITSPYSKPLQFTVYTPPTPGQPGVPGTPTPPEQLSTCVDYNKDRRVNLVDFSILLFWFEKPDPPNTIDCNADRIVDIKDFSILMYFWTG